MSDPTIHRIDLERAGTTGIFVRKWFAGWRHDGSTPCDVEDYVTGSIPALLAEYERAGFVVWMASGAQGRALRGQITRVDLIQADNTWTMRKYPYGWSAKTPPIEKKTVVPEMKDAALLWFREKQWTIFEYQDRFTAFKGEPLPIHDKATIQHLRRKAQEQQVNFQVNFAFFPT